MKTVLGLICSPRKLGNSEIAVKEISRRIGEPHQLKLIRLSEFTIKPCHGCYMCLLKGKCIIEDDLSLIIKAFIQADAFIIVAPTYCLGANASLKLLADRVLAFSAHSDKIWNKPAVGVGIAGLEGKEGYTKLNIDSFMRLFLMKAKASKIIYGALPGEVRLNNANDVDFSMMAASLFGEPVADMGPKCPMCGGDTFRFLGDSRVRCMLCSNDGTFEAGTAGYHFNISMSDHELFLDPEAASHHGQWLRGMKEKFKERKNDLREVTQAYKNQGEWIRPDPG